jgi:phosphoenolpyruvate carboxykinase (GTP)
MIDELNMNKLEALGNEHVIKIVKEYVELCKPAKVTVLTDSKEDIEYVRNLAIKNGEEKKLAIEGHTIHYDGINDQARDKANTRVMIEGTNKLSKAINTIPKEEGLKEVLDCMKGVMEGKEMIVCFYCLGPLNSKFSISALQMTDSAYVAHSENILYRPGYEQFKKLNGSDEFFHFIHSAGELDERGNSVNLDKRRIYIDLEEERVFTVNNQYAGNSVGLKKLALRLAISKAHKEDWLSEHMFVMGVHPEGKDRVTYFTGAYPSACGKTSTAMIPGQSIVGDDIAYIKIGEDGRAYATNVEQGIFGIIKDVNPEDDALIHEVLMSPRELIVSNVLIKDSVPYWLGMGKEFPEDGENFAGKWEKSSGKDPAHKNARYTIRISDLSNADPEAENPNGVPVSGVIYGGRDSDTSPPVVESLSWAHGVFIGAALESETTAATLGAQGVRKHCPMANLDFLVVPIGNYIENHLKFEEDLDMVPKIFATNYFMKKNDKFLTEKVDKKVWLMWMEGRVHEEYDAIQTPIGNIPLYEDLVSLFGYIFNKEFPRALYDELFTIRVGKLIEQLDRIEEIYQAEDNIPEMFHKHIEQQKTRLLEAKEKFGDIILPEKFE